VSWRSRRGVRGQGSGVRGRRLVGLVCPDPVPTCASANRRIHTGLPCLPSDPSGPRMQLRSTEQTPQQHLMLK